MCAMCFSVRVVSIRQPDSANIMDEEPERLLTKQPY